MPVFRALGYNLSDVVKGDTQNIPDGPALTSRTIRHPRGSLILYKGTIYFLGQDSRYPFPSAEVFLSWENKFHQVVQANSADLSVPEGPIVTAK
jgi:hypothetical protein